MQKKQYIAVANPQNPKINRVRKIKKQGQQVFHAHVLLEANLF